eukprot:8473160-Pyramimonas_sp.AAC.1
MMRRLRKTFPAPPHHFPPTYCSGNGGMCPSYGLGCIPISFFHTRRAPLGSAAGSSAIAPPRA